MANQDYQPGDTVELKHKETGFFDDETELKVVRDQKVKLGDSIGRKTNAALMSGALLVVSGKATKKGEQSSPPDESDLPADFPGRDAFIAAGLNLEAVRNLKTDEDLLKVKGIGKATVDLLKEWAKKNA